MRTYPLILVVGFCVDLAPVKITTGCSRMAGGCGKYQGLWFKDGDKSRELFFRSSEEREAYYKKHIQGESRFSSFRRGSVCSSRRRWSSS